MAGLLPVLSRRRRRDRKCARVHRRQRGTEVAKRHELLSRVARDGGFICVVDRHAMLYRSRIHG